MEFYNRTGKMALGSRLRRLSELITEQAAEIYEQYHVEMQPKWFPVFYDLSDGSEKSIMQIAQEIGHSHPSVSTIVKEMQKKGIVEESPNKTDGRKNFIRLSAKGIAINEKLQEQITDVNAAMETAFKETQHNLWKAIEEWEFLLEQKSLLKRVQDERRLRESTDIVIAEYQPEYQQAFRALNEEWISRWFVMEEQDYKALDHPQEYILDKGGHIFIALYKGEPVGTVALIKMKDNIYEFELAKMAVSPKAKGRGIGLLLGQAAIGKAREQGAHKLYLESNTILKPAINLYHKLGFKKITGVPSPYERCNIQMELTL